MSKSLAVFLNQVLVGYLEQDIHGRNSFTYDEIYLNSTDATPISRIMPLGTEKFDHNICHAFFAGILPEELSRKIIARCLGISANNDFSLLEKIGGECAGAISFLPLNQIPSISKYHYKELSNSDLNQIFDELPRRPLLAGEQGIRLSLAGVQDKLPIAVFENKNYLPLNNAPSTHIIKPQISSYDFNTVWNEGFCLKLAKRIGLHVADCSIENTGIHSYLLVKRYDRVITTIMSVQRLHQEDFCQALGIAPERKYQNEGGPSLSDCFKLLRGISSNIITDILRLLDAVIFNYIIGNCDAHGKNFSILYTNKKANLSPLYDLLSTMIYEDLTPKMSMKIGTEYHANKINKNDFIELAKIVNLNRPLMLDRIIEICDLIIVNLDLDEFQDMKISIIQNFIENRTKNIRSKFLNF